MAYRIREVNHNGKFGDLVNLGLLQKLIPTQVIEDALRDAEVKPGRYRKVNQTITVILILGLMLYPGESISTFLHTFIHQISNLWSLKETVLITEDAFSHRRYSINSKCFKLIWERTVGPLAKSQSKGTHLLGLHLLAIDSTVFDVPDTEANREYFKYPHETTPCPFPQARAVLLVECGTRTIIDAVVSPCRTSERDGGYAFLKKFHPGQLVMWDRGFHSYDFVKAVQETSADFLGRLKVTVKLKIVKELIDGSYLAELKPPADGKHKKDKPIIVRLLTYTVEGDGETHRLISSLLDPIRYPAKLLITEYHQRWEIEVSIGQVKMSLGLGTVLRSKKPEGVLQEIYATFIMQYVASYYRYESAKAHKLDPDRISFVSTVAILKEAITDGQQYIEEQYDLLHKRVIESLGGNLVPKRDGRFNYRVVKGKYSPFAIKRPKHNNPPKAVKSFTKRIAISTLKVIEQLVAGNDFAERVALRC